MMRTIRRKVLGMKMEAMRSEQGIISSTVIFFCLHDIHPCYSVFNHLCLQLCLPTQRMGVKKPFINDELSYLYTPAAPSSVYSPLLSDLYKQHLHAMVVRCAGNLVPQYYQVLQYFEVAPEIVPMVVIVPMDLFLRSTSRK